MWRPWVRRKMLNYALHTLIKMISKIDYREMSSKIINVSKNVNNYNSETWNTKNALKNFFHQKYHHPLPLPSHFFICLENFKNLRNVMSYQTVLSGRIVEDAWFFFLSFFFFFLPSIEDERPRKEKWQHDSKCPLCLKFTLEFWHTPPKDLCIIFIVWVLPSFSNMWLPSSSQLSHELCYFLHLSVNHCFITDVSSFSAFCCNRFQKQERQGNFFFKEEF